MGLAHMCFAGHVYTEVALSQSLMICDSPHRCGHSNKFHNKLIYVGLAQAALRVCYLTCDEHHNMNLTPTCIAPFAVLPHLQFLITSSV